MKFDIVVVGGGPGGYVAALRAASRGASVALVEGKNLGGTCLNVGCIPTKAMLSNAEVLSKIKHSDRWGIQLGDIKIDFSKMTDRKDEVVTGIRTSLEGLLKANGIEIVRGWGKLISPTEVKVVGDETKILQGNKIIIATGSEPLDVPIFPFDPPLVHSSSSILELRELPESLVVIGGGVIGCEAACLYAELGVRVTILELLPTILSTEPAETAKFLTKAFKEKLIDVRTGVKVLGIDKSDHVSVRIENGDPIEASMALVAVGRKINTEAIGLEAIGIPTKRPGFVEVNERMETSVPSVYAIGDITGKYLLAHVASHQGIVAADNATGKPAAMHYNAVPSVVYTHPEAASVGMTLEQAKAAGHNAESGRFPFQVLGRSIAAAETEGYANVVIDKETGAILGASAVCHDAGTLIAQMTQAIANELTVECVEETIHAHPTTSEAWLEATLLAAGRPVHLPPKRRR